MLHAEDIQIRDPFILRCDEEGAYYLYGTVGGKRLEDGRTVPHFMTYRTRDLVEFEEPIEVFDAPEGFWADRDFWAPEVHRYHGKYYMFASFKAPDKCRGTQILVCDTPAGRFVPLTKEPVTPRDWECLDGTLYVDDAGKPWIVFCHEWLQIHDGAICAMPLTEDLTQAAGAPQVLFHASDAPFAPQGQTDYVTDGPFLFRMQHGRLGMLWSSFIPETGYAQYLAVSDSGIDGTWTQTDTPVYVSDGGHGMLFEAFDGRLLLTLHAPNRWPEHPRFLAVAETASGTLACIENQ